MPAIINSDGKRVLYTDGKQILRAAGTGCGCCGEVQRPVRWCEDGAIVVGLAVNKWDLPDPEALFVFKREGICFYIDPEDDDVEGWMVLSLLGTTSYDSCEECGDDDTAPCECPGGFTGTTLTLRFHVKSWEAINPSEPPFASRYTNDETKLGDLLTDDAHEVTMTHQDSPDGCVWETTPGFTISGDWGTFILTYLTLMCINEVGQWQIQTDPVDDAYKNVGSTPTGKYFAAQYYLYGPLDPAPAWRWVKMTDITVIMS